MKEKPIETCALYSEPVYSQYLQHSKSHPQGFLKLWIEMYTGEEILHNKIPRDITNGNVDDMEVRVVIWETKGVTYPRSGRKDLSVMAALDKNKEPGDW